MKLLIQVIAVLSLVGSGCSKAPVLYPVEGELTSPLAVMRMMEMRIGLNEVVPYAELQFVPQSADALEARGMTDAGGRFMLETPSLGLGAVAGEYKVVVKVNPEYFRKPVSGHYSDPDATTLTVEIPEGGASDLKVHLDKEVKVKPMGPANESPLAN